MANKLRLVFAVLLTMVVSIVMYVFIHEAGHAIVAMSCGASISGLSIISAHTQYIGGSFTAITEALCYAAGAALPVCVSWIAMIFYSKRCKSLLYHMVYVFFFIMSTSSLIAWVVLPVCSMFSPLTDQTDDVAGFLDVSGISPVIVCLTAAAAILLGIFIAVKKRIFSVLIQLAKDIGYGRTNSDVERFVSKKSMAWVAAAASLAVFAAVLLELPSFMAKPVISFAVEDGVPTETTYKTFDIRQESVYHFQTRIDAEGLLAVVRISNSADEPVFQNIIFDRSDSDSTFLLLPDTYALSVTYLTDDEMFEHYCSEMGYNSEELHDLTSVYEKESRLSELFIELE